jgi:hypothetical protein
MYNFISEGSYNEKKFYYFSKSMWALVDSGKIKITDDLKIAMADMMTVMVESTSSLIEYKMDASALMVAFVTKVIPLFKKKKKKKKKKKSE